VATRDDMDFLINNTRLHKIIKILSDFAQGGRYYDLNIVTNGHSGFDEPKDKWEELETEICLENKQISDNGLNDSSPIFIATSRKAI